MDPREALDTTIKIFNLRAIDIAQQSGVDPQMISRYRNKRKDMNSLNLYKIVNVLPLQARVYFSSLLIAGGVIESQSNLPQIEHPSQSAA